jgi:cell division protein FtsQ
MPLPPPPSNNASDAGNAAAQPRKRARRAPAVQPREPVAGDVRLLNVVASSVFVLVALGALLAGVLWLMRSSLFPIREIRLDGDLTRNSVATVRANAAPLLAGNFFSVDLQQGRAAFETVPWVRHAVVRRVWPGMLAVRLEEHRVAAFWEGTGDDVGGRSGDDKLVNTFGEVFEANIGDVEDEPLPRLAGPDGSAAQVLGLYRRLQPAFESMEMVIERLSLSHRGSWRAELDSGAIVELGRGSDDEVVARSERFVRTLSQVTARWKQPLDYADLRHADGYALRLRGVSTTAAKPN